MEPQKGTTYSAHKKLPLDTEETTTSKATKATESDSVEEVNIKKPSFGERWKTSRFWLVRGAYYALFSVWAIVMAIGGVIAWIIAMLFI
ncbi:hypothetical protein [Gelidibacter salicanalis]|uniref:Uncharacterized protein n=1 Tax=Gelidibacter salicanalis TaxID=291193 RepID=A0A934KLS1_9FLAO|nr:hypothetical protein [Gelidibacter salicanalis]MBJ7881751.1 hypothetical protein [Gelidibacter salicanalis]